MRLVKAGGYRVASSSLAAFLVGVGMGCSDPRDSGDSWGGTVDTLPGGGVRVHSPAAGIWLEDEAWELVEDLRIGSMESEGADLFGEIADVAARDGVIHVVESQAHEVRLFGEDGSHLRSFGREGQGPGELNIRFGGQVLLPEGGIWVNNAMNRRWEFFTPEGEVVGSSRDASAYFGARGYLGADGALYLRTRAATGGEAEPRDALLRMEYLDRALVVTDTLFAPPLPAGEIVEASMSGNGNRMTMLLPVPFVHQPQWTFDPGGFFWADFAEGYRLHAIGFDGDTLRVIERDYTPSAVSSQERDEAASRFSSGALAGADLDFDESMMADVHPPFERFLTDELGNLWVKRALGDDRWAWEVFDQEGRYLGAVRTDTDLARLSVHQITADAVYGVLRDDLDVPYVVRLGIRRPGGEGAG